MYTFYIFILTCLLSFISCEKDKCEICTEMSKKFTEGMERTSGHNFGGGNTDWEETRLGSFANSETRLVDILENVCSSTECHTLVEEHEEDIEEWWFKQMPNGVELEKWLCADTLNFCCPKGRFGPNCEECPGGVDNPCGSHGKCKGDGSRSGTGECECDDGYTGDRCEECDDGYYQDHESQEPKCLECHKSCDGACIDGTPKGCETCKDGWQETEEHGCTDKNECETESICGAKKYCINTEGSYDCLECDRSCAENCTIGGARGCLACAVGYEMTENEGCRDRDECEEGVTCQDGTYCINTPGSYTCGGCHKSCTKCNGGGSQKCTECSNGYQMSDINGCEDKDECNEGAICTDGKHCTNIPGSYQCDVCHKSCSKCIGPGSIACTLCSDGYEKTEKGCEDIDECKRTDLCAENERCKNTIGSYVCKCSKGFKRKDGKCVKKKSKKKNSDDEEILDEVRQEDKSALNQEASVEENDLTNNNKDTTSLDGDVINDDVANDKTSNNDNDAADLDRVMKEEL